MKEIFTIDYIKSYISRNANYFIISIIIFLISALLGFYFNNYFNNILPDHFRMATSIIDEINVDFRDIFIHNIFIDLSVVFNGFLFSIDSIITTVLNGVLLGYAFSRVNTILFVVGITPHGIFEIPSSIFALAGALMLTHFTINMAKAALSKNNTMKDEYHNNSCYLLEAYIVTFIICFILLAVAAFIEGNITEPLGYLGLFMLGIL